MILRARGRVSLSLFVIACALAAGCKSEKSEDASSTDQAVGSAEPGQGAPKHKHELPPAAFDACQGKAVGGACTVQFGDRQIEAKCASTSDSRLACRPERGDRKKPEGS